MRIPTTCLISLSLKAGIGLFLAMARLALTMFVCSIRRMKLLALNRLKKDITSVLQSSRFFSFIELVGIYRGSRSAFTHSQSNTL